MIKYKYFLILVLFLLSINWILKNVNFNFRKKIGEEIDSFNGVSVYHNGGVNNVSGRNLSTTGYNIGLKYQCVEFIKRYYYEYLNHKMPDTYGHAKSFFDNKLKDGELNKKRNLKQFTNSSSTKPKINDIVVFDSSIFNRYGHVAIITKVEKDFIEIIQQNSGSLSKTREKISLKNENGKWKLGNNRILGYLRK